MYSKTYYTCTDKNDCLLLCTVYMIKEPLCIYTTFGYMSFRMRLIDRTGKISFPTSSHLHHSVMNYHNYLYSYIYNSKCLNIL